METLPDVSGSGRLRIGRQVRLSGVSTFSFSNRLGEHPLIVIGDGTFIGHGCALHAASSVTIGRHCLIAAGVWIYDFDGHPYDAAARRRKEPFPATNCEPVTIGNDVWIGARATILRGVTIGDRAIVGSGAVVTRDVPPDTVVGGNPARPVRTLSRADSTPAH
ncbi:acyltransferase [Aquabacterium sp. A7-Y]|nr:acyltransferase [Aquabacterium sp. A7-Y]